MNDPRMQNISNQAVLAPAEARTGLEEDYSDNRIEEIEELKHAIRTHVIINNGVSDQLCAFLLKLIDFLTDEDDARKRKEILSLAYTISEACALYISGVVDSHINRLEAEGSQNQQLKDLNNNILVEIGKWRSDTDKIAAKRAVLRSASASLSMFSNATRIQYPQLVDSNGLPYTS